MKKLFFNCLFTALTFGMLMSVNAMATETDAPNSIIIDEESKNIALSSEEATQDGVTAIKMSLQISADEADEISFKFNKENTAKVADFRYHEDTGILNIYMADNEPLFNDESDLLNLGTVKAKDKDGNSINVEIQAAENALSFVAQHTITEKMFDVKNASEFKSTNEVEVIGKSLNVQKTFSEDYLITIPEGTDTLKENQEFNVNIDNVLIKYGQQLKLSVTSEYGWQLKNKKYPDSNDGITYRMKYGDNAKIIEEPTETILTVGDGKKSDSVTLIVYSIAEPTFAGTFDDKLTFSVNVS